MSIGPKESHFCLAVVLQAVGMDCIKWKSCLGNEDEPEPELDKVFL